MAYREYIRPKSVEEAVTHLATKANALPIAGGTDLMPQLHAQKAKIDVLVDISAIPELIEIHLVGDRLSIGACVTFTQIIQSSTISRFASLLIDASNQIGAKQIQNMGTVGGNLVTASPAGDIIPCLFVLNAEVRLVSPGSNREVPIADFFLGSGKTALHPGELISQVSFARLESHTGSAFEKYGLRQALAVSVISAAGAITIQEGRIAKAAIALGAVAPTVVRSHSAEDFLVGQEPCQELFAEAGSLARNDVQPISDLRGSAIFRRHLVKPVVSQMLLTAWRRSVAQVTNLSAG